MSLMNSYLCYAIVFLGRTSGFGLDFCRIPIGKAPAGGPILRLPYQNPAEIRSGGPISGPEALLRNIGYERALRLTLSWPAKTLGDLGGLAGLADRPRRCPARAFNHTTSQPTDMGFSGFPTNAGGFSFCFFGRGGPPKAATKPTGIVRIQKSPHRWVRPPV